MCHVLGIERQCWKIDIAVDGEWQYWKIDIAVDEVEEPVVLCQGKTDSEAESNGSDTAKGD